ncbi:tripartite tricarboxylate transporter TctB family protein [uncultured Sphaerochaeta sp.]|uniref:tripartite tricarboxylate transporter TctB family protein n=1 Tax=uncultured Sphaerochaeta sp. TaxID=886478 RepID=UPI0029CA6B6F|nr:tripartite tricarboxylate transporter TctB family protein [uncultured Sphaerochaeta sp.]
MDIVIVIIEILVAIVWIQQGVVRYVFWENGRPGGGFVPVIFAVIVLAAALAILIKVVFGKNQKETYVFQPSAFIPVVAAVLGGFMLQVGGIGFSVFLFTSIWMRFLSKYSWVKTLITSAIFTFFIYGIFRMWLRVPFPQGFIFQLF